MSSIQYPFQLINAFFPEIHFKRSPTYEQKSVNVTIAVTVIDDNFPEDVEVHLCVKTADEEPLQFDITLVGKYRYVGKAPENDQATVHRFAQEKAVYLLWPFITEMVRSMTPKLGIPPVFVPTPLALEIKPAPAPG